jgi:glucose/arabinose dehydrogenase
MSTGSPKRLLPFILASAVALAACSDGTGSDVTFSTVAPATTATDPAPSTSSSDTPETSAPTTTSSTVAETSTTTAAALPELTGLTYTPLTDATFPVVITARPGDADPLVALKDGQVARVVGGELEVILDISGQVANEGERGLLGMALHPDDPGRLFLHYSNNAGDTIVSEFTLDGAIDPGSERVLFTADQPAGNHNGGWIQFGPDGGLYLGLGDGGGANDQFDTGQADGPLASLIRIDVDSAEAEKYAKGLRNPWRFWIDGDTVYIADVGQNAFEEVSVTALEPGLNYGWPIMEGTHCFSPREGCDTSGLVIPVVEVEHGDAGTCSITGGVVYRGSAIPELAGHYFYSDFCGGYLRSFRSDGGEATDQTDWTDQVGVPGQIVSFGVDGAGEMYVLTTGQILRVDPVRAP